MNAFPFASYIVAAVFALAIGTTLAGALIAVSSQRIIRAVTGLMICCVGLAGLYYFLNSPFLALMEILIYVGAVCVTIVFGVMLAEPDWPVNLKHPRAFHKTLLAALVSAAIGGGLAGLALHAPWPAQPVQTVNDGSVAAIGTSLLTTYSFVFELISLVLLVAILGALVIARAGRSRTVTGLGTFADENARAAESITNHSAADAQALEEVRR
ncbi:NADH-quinone oxidoreductase subunit J family protein [Opitutus terrae]|uniref:NADH-quinone oxidoreductase subunit J n=1 Tax=Opitutus terrae (strain DSM 11246 / JCM 15787 / PB90-1) TaxID=452637 RepID=B1ZUJ5_OPITP|nr:NADH-quinone oxidoreductase subunit J [Opitutus terrae]ACB74038.1 NADH-ubiquinone/plastoquinone oxidoreductase chain 6 [Opitutus terrae PB90-1]